MRNWLEKGAPRINRKGSEVFYEYCVATTLNGGNRFATLARNKGGKIIKNVWKTNL